ARAGTSDLLSLILKLKCDPNAPNAMGQLPLVTACGTGGVTDRGGGGGGDGKTLTVQDLVPLLLSGGANPTHVNAKDGRSCIHSRWISDDNLALCIKSGADA